MTKPPIQSISPCLSTIVRAGDMIPEMKGKLGHSGPPLSFDQLLPLQRNAILDVLLYEEIMKESQFQNYLFGSQQDIKQAVEFLFNEGKITLQSNHDFDIVAPLVGIVSESMPLLVIEDMNSGKKVYTPINEGIGESIRGGNLSIDAVKRLSWIENTLAPNLKECLDGFGPVPLLPFIQEALKMGDELHMRNTAASMLLGKELQGRLLNLSTHTSHTTEIFSFLNQNPFLFLNISMAVSKLYLKSFGRYTEEPIVTNCCANGKEIGIQISTRPGKWFTSNSTVPIGKQSIKEPICPTIGDSLIVEAFGMGGRLTTLAPGLWESLGLKDKQELFQNEERLTEVSYDKLFTASFNFLHYDGISIGINVKKAAISGFSIPVNTAILRLNGGISGIGRANIPLECFQKSLQFTKSVAKEVL